MIGIYGIKNLITGKMYIGQSININNRFRDHLYELRKGTHHSPYLQNSFIKYGEKAFINGVIEECPRKLLNIREQYWIDYYNSYKEGYNATKVNNLGGRVFDNKAIETHSKAMKKYYSKLSDKERKSKMAYMRSFIDYNNIDYYHRIKSNCKLYNPKTLELEKEFDYIYDCAEFLETTVKHLHKILDRIWKEKGQSYKGYYIIRQNETLEDYLNIVNHRIEYIKLRSENKKDSYYTLKPEEERLNSWKKNSQVAVDKLRNTQIIKVYKNSEKVGDYTLVIDAAKDLEIKPEGIYKVLSGYRNSYYGYTFEKAGI